MMDRPYMSEKHPASRMNFPVSVSEVAYSVAEHQMMSFMNPAMASCGNGSVNKTMSYASRNNLYPAVTASHVFDSNHQLTRENSFTLNPAVSCGHTISNNFAASTLRNSVCGGNVCTSGSHNGIYVGEGSHSNLNGDVYCTNLMASSAMYRRAPVSTSQGDMYASSESSLSCQAGKPFPRDETCGRTCISNCSEVVRPSSVSYQSESGSGDKLRYSNEPSALGWNKPEGGSLEYKPAASSAGLTHSENKRLADPHGDDLQQISEQVTKSPVSAMVPIQPAQLNHSLQTVSESQTTKTKRGSTGGDEASDDGAADVKTEPVDDESHGGGNREVLELGSVVVTGSELLRAGQLDMYAGSTESEGEPILLEHKISRTRKVLLKKKNTHCPLKGDTEIETKPKSEQVSRPVRQSVRNKNICGNEEKPANAGRKRAAKAGRKKYRESSPESEEEIEAQQPCRRSARSRVKTSTNNTVRSLKEAYEAETSEDEKPVVLPRTKHPKRTRAKAKKSVIEVQDSLNVKQNGQRTSMRCKKSRNAETPSKKFCKGTDSGNEQANATPEIISTKKNPPKKTRSKKTAALSDGNLELLDNEESKRNCQKPRKKTVKSEPKTVKPTEESRERDAFNMKKFQCHECSRWFTQRSNLMKHMRVHTGEKVFGCKICSQEFDTAVELRDHSKQHRHRNSFPCSVCKKKFMHAVILTIHMRTHTGEKPLQCSQCDETFAMSSALVAHMKIHSVVKTYKCPVCYEKFTDPKEHKIHVKKHQGERPFPCTLCKRAFPMSGDLTLHMKTHIQTDKRYPCSLCSKSFKLVGDLSRHRKMYHKEGTAAAHMTREAGENPYRCMVCKKNFIRSDDLTRHMRIHTGEKPYACNTCNKRFSQSCSLTMHMRTHTGERPFQCTYCGKKFTQTGHLTTHLKTHTEDKYACTMCPRTFKEPEHLEKHIEAHNSKNLHQCVLCNKPFKRADDLTRHMRTHTGDKPFQCTLCPRKFTQQGTLTSHLRTHTGEKPFQCTICSKKFTQAGTLNTHMKTHGGGTPFHCVLCPMQFKVSRDLTNHLKTHTGEKPFQCKLCGKHFTQASYFTKHLRTHVAEKSLQQPIHVPDESQPHLTPQVSLEGLTTESQPNHAVPQIMNKPFVPLPPLPPALAPTNQGMYASAMPAVAPRHMIPSHIPHAMHIIPYNGPPSDMIGYSKMNHNVSPHAPHKGMMPSPPLDNHISRSSEEFLQGHTPTSFTPQKTMSQNGLPNGVSHNTMSPSLSKQQPGVMAPNFVPGVSFNGSASGEGMPAPCSKPEFDSTQHMGSNQAFRSMANTHSELKQGWEPLVTLAAVTIHQSQGNPTPKKVDSTKMAARMDDLLPDIQTTEDGDFANLKPAMVKKQNGETEFHKQFEEFASSQMDRVPSVGSGDVDDYDGGDDAGDYHDDHSDYDDTDDVEQPASSISQSSSLQQSAQRQTQPSKLRSASTSSSSPDKPYKCVKCHLSFSYESNLNIHMRIHAPRIHECVVCHKQFDERGTLTIHMRQHTGENPYQCIVCRKPFIRSDDLARHMRIHTGEKPYKCASCNKGFSQSCALTAHMRTHTGEKPFSCSVCSKGFNQSGHLTAHMRTHTGEKPYSCVLCQKQFKVSGHLDKHMKTHTGEKPHPCTLCTKRFADSSGLKTHMRSHTGEKPYSCSVCQKRFSMSSHVTKHMKTHTGEKPFQCPTCLKQFSHSRNLHKHSKACSGERSFQSILLM